MVDTELSATRVRRARLAVMAYFVGVGTLAGTIISRMPSVRDSLDVSPAQLGAILLVGSIGGLLAFSVLGGLVARFGSLAVVRWGSASNGAGLALMSGGTVLGVPAMYAGGLFIALGTIEAVMAVANTQAAGIERRVGSAIMSQFHAGFSLAMLGGIGLGSLASRLGVSVAVQLAVTGTIACTAFVLVARTAILDAVHRDQTARDRKGGIFVTVRMATRERRTVLLGLILLAAFTTEVGSSSWIPLALVDDYASTEAIAGVVYAGVVLAQSITRVVGPRWVDAQGRVTTLRASAVLLAAGSLLFAFSPVFWAVPLAMLIWGVGTAFAFPIALSSAADDPRDATARVAAVSAFGSAGGLIIPQVIGLLAEVVQIRQALLIVVVAAATIFVLAPAARPLPEAAPEEGTREGAEPAV